MKRQPCIPLYIRYVRTWGPEFTVLGCRDHKWLDKGVGLGESLGPKLSENVLITTRVRQHHNDGITIQLDS